MYVTKLTSSGQDVRTEYFTQLLKTAMPFGPEREHVAQFQPLGYNSSLVSKITGIL